MATGAAARYGADSRSGRGFVDTTGALQDLSDVAAEDAPRIVTGLSEFDRVMGGGLVKGGVSLIGGDPGIGKSTLLLQVMARLAAAGLSCIYVSGEESAAQIALRTQRLQLPTAGLKLMSEIELEHIEAVINEKRPEFVVIDSIQTLFSGALDSAPGSVSQVRECAARLPVRPRLPALRSFLWGTSPKKARSLGRECSNTSWIRCFILRAIRIRTFDSSEPSKIDLARSTNLASLP